MLRPLFYVRKEEASQEAVDQFRPAASMSTIGRTGEMS